MKKRRTPLRAAVATELAKRGLTESDLALGMGVSKQRVSQILGEESPSPVVLLRVADGLGWSLETLKIHVSAGIELVHRWG